MSIHTKLSEWWKKNYILICEKKTDLSPGRWSEQEKVRRIKEARNGKCKENLILTLKLCELRQWMESWWNDIDAHEFK